MLEASGIIGLNGVLIMGVVVIGIVLIAGLAAGLITENETVMNAMKKFF